MPTDRIGLAWLAEIVAIDARKAMPTYWHQHKRQLEVIYCLHGEMSYDFKDRPGISIPGGRAIVIPPGVEHRITKGVDPPCRRLSILINTTLPRRRRYVVFSQKEFRDLYEATIAKAFKPFVFSRPTFALLNALWDTLTSLPATPSPLLTSRIRLQICTILHDSAVSNPAPGEKESGHLIDEAIRWLENHVGEAVRIHQLVTFMGYGRARLFELFRERTGLSPAGYLTRLRIRKAEALIRNHPLRSISAISHEVGFRDPSHFSAIFKRMTGKSPSDCRATSMHIVHPNP